MKIVTNKDEIEKAISLIVNQYPNSDPNNRAMLEDDLMKLLSVTTKNKVFTILKASHLLKKGKDSYTDEDQRKTIDGFRKTNQEFINDFSFNVNIGRANAEILVPKVNIKFPKIDSNVFYQAINEFVLHLNSEEQELFSSIVNENGLIMTKGKNNGQHFKLYSLNRHFIEISQRYFSYLSYEIFCHEFGHAAATAHDQHHYNEILNSKNTYLTETLSILYAMLGINVLSNSNPPVASILMKYILHDYQQNAIVLVKRSEGKKNINSEKIDSGLLAYFATYIKQYIKYIYGTSIASILLEERERDELAYKQKVDILKKDIGYRDDFDVLSDIEITKDTLLKQEAYRRLVKKII